MQFIASNFVLLQPIKKSVVTQKNQENEAYKNHFIPSFIPFFICIIKNFVNLERRKSNYFYVSLFRIVTNNGFNKI